MRFVFFSVLAALVSVAMPATPGQAPDPTTENLRALIKTIPPLAVERIEIKVGGIPDPKREFCGATDIAFGPGGNVYIGDGYCNGRVLEYTADGKKVKAWGKKGTGPGEFNNVHGIALGPDGNLYIADRENGRLQWFDINGKFLGERAFGGPFYNITFDNKGNMYAATHSKGVSLDEEFNLLKFDFKTGKILGQVEVRSHGVGVSPDGTLMPATRSDLLVVYRQK